MVKSKLEDPEIVARNKEIVKNKSVNELSQIRDISDFPVPDGIENFFKHKQQTMADNEKMWDKSYLFVVICITFLLYLLGVWTEPLDQHLHRALKNPSTALCQDHWKNNSSLWNPNWRTRRKFVNDKKLSERSLQLNSPRYLPSPTFLSPPGWRTCSKGKGEMTSIVNTK